ncbi:hypothetical protein uav_016 [Pseudomonas phage UAVern]|uniref:Uncharacterized protein n=1 Tax=Pseudomonas phage UAVern TaxID=2856997 RepID=A0A975UWA1_9CAUD|nr:hypothetical protein uav_016 [Pseudomonas phage UAVern]
MARSLNGGAPDKPIVPLRFRINPKLKQLEEIEALERELRASGLQHRDIDSFNDLLEDLNVRRRKVMPEPKPKPLTKEEQEALDDERYASMPFYPSPSKSTVVRHWLLSNVNDRLFKWILFSGVLLWLYCKNKA